MLIREAMDRFLAQHAEGRQREVLREAAGLWADRADAPSLRRLRES